MVSGFFAFSSSSWLTEEHTNDARFINANHMENFLMSKSTTKKPVRREFLKWTVELEVHPVWVADGFDLTDERAHCMLVEHLNYCFGHEVRAKVLTKPRPSIVKGLQSGAIGFPGDDEGTL